MVAKRSAEYLEDLVRELCKLSHESEWVEFKLSNDKPDLIGEYISALANSAAYCGKLHSYLLWGIEDERELIANTIIHQDFHIGGTALMVEIFDNQMEITNPLLPLIKTDRFLDCPPRSRNEALASFMRRIGICEEMGSSVDKVVIQTELFQLPAPRFRDHRRTHQGRSFFIQDFERHGQGGENPGVLHECRLALYSKGYDDQYNFARAVRHRDQKQRDRIPDHQEHSGRGNDFPIRPGGFQNS